MILTKVLTIYLLTLLAWIVVFLSRSIGVLDFDPLSIASIFSILVFLISIIIGGLGASLLFHKGKRDYSISYDIRSVKFIAKMLLFFQFIAIFSLTFKYMDLLFSGISVSAITAHRFQQGIEVSNIGGSVSGVVGFVFSGFLVVGACYSYHFKRFVGDFTRFFLLFNFILGSLLQSLNGGRFGLIIIFLVLFFFVFFYGGFRKYVNLRNTVLFVFFGSLVFIYFNSIFVSRFIGDEYSSQAALLVVENRIVSAQATKFLKTVLLESSFSEFIFSLSMYIYYIGHSLNQFELVVESASAGPFFLQYQLYPLFAMLNKVGFDFSTIDYIISTFPTEGVYFTALGAAYVDFGYGGMILYFLFLGCMGGYFLVKAICSKQFGFLLMASLYSIYLILSPIISVINTSLFPSLLIACIFFVFFSPRFKKIHED